MRQKAGLSAVIVALVLAAGCSSGASHQSVKVPETAGGAAHTWRDPQTAGGQPGPEVGSGETVAVACRLQGFKVTDGNAWWYRLKDSPWHDRFYVSADAFYNNGKTSGSLRDTPFFDPKVPVCTT